MCCYLQKYQSYKSQGNIELLFEIKGDIQAKMQSVIFLL